MRKYVDHPLILLYWYAVVGGTDTGCLLGFVKGDEELSTGTEAVLMSFIILFFVTFVLVAGPLLYNAEFYSPDKPHQRRTTYTAAALLWALTDTPLVAIHLYIYSARGLVSIIQGIAFILRLLSWVGCFLILWLVGLKRVADWLHSKTGCDEELARELLKAKAR
eukprot:TRINITY_DN12634_c0_g1_i1.p1 TRINITY_DN12634_c0_g1~~TRINITY_DN12634_c0_g1_i1.p1  ORF type:complete len:164 (+),score=27.96 TRINITY_DN12634_c0_g1_i1:86-577(+)